MEELINIGNYVNTIMIKYGEHIDTFTAIYLDREDILECKVHFKKPYFQRDDYFTFQICSFNFTMSDTEILVNKFSIDELNKFIEKYINNIKDNVTV